MALKFLPNALGSAYPIALPAFEGPLDLLLNLIERQELDVNVISLVAVTDAYLKTLEQLEEIEPGSLADFLVVASKLIFLKSRSLLPKPRPPKEEGEEEDPSDALIRQLLAYRQFKRIANQLQERDEKGLRAYVRTATMPMAEKRLDLSNLDVERLRKALHKALQRIPDDPPLPTVRTYTLTVSEQVVYIRSMLQDMRKEKGGPLVGQPKTISFEALLSQKRTRMEMVVTFLAVLELIKQQELEVIQEKTFGDISLAATPLSYPTPPHSNSDRSKD